MQNLLLLDPDKIYEMQVSVEQARNRLEEKVRADSIKKKAELAKVFFLLLF